VAPPAGVAGLPPSAVTASGCPARPRAGRTSARSSPRTQCGTLTGSAWTSSPSSRNRCSAHLTAASAAGEPDRRGPMPSEGSATLFGVEIALVTNLQDPQKLGRVKVCFPRMSGMPESDWARVVQPAAGPGRGFYWLPEVNDEVLVAFEMGQPNRPYVLRGLWNAKDKPMKDAYAD